MAEITIDVDEMGQKTLVPNQIYGTEAMEAQTAEGQRAGSPLVDSFVPLPQLQRSGFGHTPPAPTPIRPSAETLLSAIMEGVNNPSFQLEKMNGLFKLYRDMYDMQAEREFIADLAQMKGEIPEIKKTGHNKQTDSRYAKLEDIQRAIKEPMKKYGFSLSGDILEQSTEWVKVKVILDHRSGWKRYTICGMPPDIAGIQGNKNKTMVHAIASSITHCRRVGITTLLSLDGEDLDGQSLKKLITPEQVDIINNLMEKVSKAARDAMLEKYGSVPDIPQAKYSSVVSVLQKRLPNTGEKLKKEKAEMVGDKPVETAPLWDRKSLFLGGKAMTRNWGSVRVAGEFLAKAMASETDLHVRAAMRHDNAALLAALAEEGFSDIVDSIEGR